jgi:uncharacterized membrane protein YphA (DoxX/SURF4 family)
MAIDRQATGLAILRVALGVFLIFEALSKYRWLTSSAPLATQLAGWLKEAAAPNRWYLEHVAIPWAGVFARLVMLGEFTCGLALVWGFWTRTFAVIAFLMVLNYHFASGALFHARFLTNGYGLPVLGGLLGLAIAGSRR